MEKNEVKPVTERIKTFDDALRELGENHSLVKNYRVISNINAEIDLLAYLKLRIIVSTLNEGWKPVFTEEEKRWYPWFYTWAKEELVCRSKKWIEHNHIHLFRGSSPNTSSCGFVYTYSNFDLSTSRSIYSTRLALKSNELEE